MSDWQELTDNLPGRMWVCVRGVKEHSGTMWRRYHLDTVYTSKNTPWPIRDADINRILRDGDMDWIEEIIWQPIVFPEART